MTSVIEFSLPKNKTINDFFLYSNDEKIKIIELGLSLYKNGLETMKYWDNTDWEKKIHDIRNKSEQQIQEKNSEVEKLKRQLLVKDNDFKEEKYNLRKTIEHDCDTRYKSQIKDLNTQITESTTQLSKWSDKYNNLYQTLNDKHDMRFKEQRDRYDNDIKIIREELNKEKTKYEQRLVISQNSTLKGQNGEEQIFKQLNLLFPSAEVIDTHNESNRGDFIVKLDNIVFMVENKNYTTNVPKAEIDKFYRDLDNDGNNDIQCAVFVSMSSGICARDDFEFEVRNNKPILFLHKLSSNFNNLKLAFKFFKLIINQKNIDITNIETEVLFRNIASDIKNNLRSLRKNLDKYYDQQKKAIQENQEIFLDIYKTMHLPLKI